MPAASLLLAATLANSVASLLKLLLSSINLARSLNVSNFTSVGCQPLPVSVPGANRLGKPELAMLANVLADATTSALLYVPLSEDLMRATLHSATLKADWRH